MKNFAGWAFTGKNKKKVFLKDKIPTLGFFYPALIERILIRRGIDKNQIDNFLNPKYEDLYPYGNWSSLKESIGLIKWAIVNKKKIHIHSDYDADGITSLAMLCAGLKYFDGNFSYSVSNRFKGGYGIPDEIFEDSLKNGCDLFISLDCGTSSFEIHNKAKKYNLPLLIIDHHLPLQEIEKSVLLCNTHLSDCPAPFSKFSTAGIIFKLMNGIYDSLNSNFPFNSYLRIASIGLAQDVVEMIGENHSIVSLGMKQIPNSKNKFLIGLLKSSGIYGRKITSDHLYYRLGPRLNAPGRMKDGTFLIELFLNSDEKKIEEGILKIESLNKMRQEIQEKIYKEAEKNLKDEKIIVSYNPNWHLGVLGLVASRLAQEKNKISFCLSKDGGFVKGSGRSIPNISLIDILKKLKDFLDKFGGHEMACGLSLKEENLENFKNALKKIEKDLSFEEEESIEVEEEVNFKELIELSEFFEMLEPFGNKNPKPVFLSHNVRFLEKPVLYNNVYFMKFVQENNVISGIGFELEKVDFPQEFSLLYYPSTYNGNFSIQFLGILT